MQLEDIQHLTDTAVADIAAAADETALEAARVRYLGRKGKLPDIMAALKTAAPEQRPQYGQAANQFKTRVGEALDARKSALAATATPANALDVTRPGDLPPLGSIHPIRQIIGRVTEIFDRIGFTVATGPDIDSVFNNFDALNTPADHPSRDPQDTFYLEDGSLLRCHTSPVQVRHMLKHPPPVRIIAPGRAYRRDTPDATHSANFHQVEGLYVDKKVSMADLKSDLTYFAGEVLGPGAKARFRPHFFPFTEPSVEVDFTCHVCKGKGCRVCKNSGWIEIAGAGMVDPNVFQAVNYDPDAVTGYAFGMGLERIAMILLEIDDIRRLYDNDVRFLRQFA
ncbi:MAG: phenylalanine--tRNA ligase subunit alpha [Verrucomicrobia bacterium]|nr:phenylalanine--tRNA ligase subunit alpha [Verrucomicrobiota bacterium]MCH8512147.1 phenylalanine--tRNA ligase subunit alpha [Kiritimatiellia bacterium]